MAVVSAAQGNRASLEETETPPAPGGGSQSEGTGKSPHGRPALLGKEATRAHRPLSSPPPSAPPGEAAGVWTGLWPGRPVPPPTDDRRGTGQWSAQTCPSVPLPGRWGGQGKGAPRRWPNGQPRRAQPSCRSYFSPRQQPRAPRTCALKQAPSPAAVKGIKRQGQFNKQSGGWDPAAPPASARRLQLRPLRPPFHADSFRGRHPLGAGRPAPWGWRLPPRHCASLHRRLQSTHCVLLAVTALGTQQ